MGPHEGSRMNDLTALNEDAAQAAFRVTGNAWERNSSLEGRTHNTADLATLLAKAIAWGAPVQFLKDGQPWISGDWRRLTLWQRLKRSFSLLRGSYVHPDGTIELASEDRS